MVTNFLKGAIQMVTIEQGEHKFFVGEDEEHPLAEITYRVPEDKQLVVEHTYVDDELRGEGVAGKLVEKVVNYARENEFKVRSECSYATSKLEKTPEYQDVLAN